MNDEPVYERPHARMIQSGNLALIGWRDAPKYEDILAWHQLGKSMARAFPEGSACVSVVVRGTPNFTEDVRSATIKMAADSGIFPMGFAHVISMPGFAGLAVRSFVQTVLVLARNPSPSKVFGDAQAASAWLAPRMRETDAGDLARTIRDFEEALSR